MWLDSYYGRKKNFYEFSKRNFLSLRECFPKKPIFILLEIISFCYKNQLNCQITRIKNFSVSSPQKPERVKFSHIKNLIFLPKSSPSQKQLKRKCLLYPKIHINLRKFQLNFGNGIFFKEKLFLSNSWWQA